MQHGHGKKPTGFSRRPASSATSMAGSSSTRSLLVLSQPVVPKNSMADARYGAFGKVIGSGLPVGACKNRDYGR